MDHQKLFQDAILEAKELYAKVDKIDALSAETAYEILQKIVDVHGIGFIEDALKHKMKEPGKGTLVRSMYDRLMREHPDMKKSEVRSMVAKHFKIADKTVQKHLYK